LEQIQELLHRDNVINMDARTVLSCLPEGFGQGASTRTSVRGKPMHSMAVILSWFTELKCKYDLNVRSVGLAVAKPWVVDGDRIFHPSGNFFEVMAVRVEADNREVPAWTQPLLKPCREGIIAYLVKKHEEEVHFLMQAKVEPGNFDILEMAPTVQCLTGDYRRTREEFRPAFLDFVLLAERSNVLFDTRQSEEGGRFFQEENRNMIVNIGGVFPDEIPENFLWVSFSQLKELMRFNNMVNVQARCLLCAVTPELMEQVG
jgi:oxidase EvaA